MPPRRGTGARKAARAASEPVSGAAMRLADGGEAIFIGMDGDLALLRVGTAHPAPLRLSMEGLELVDEGSETARHRKFRAIAQRRGEIGG